MLYLFSIEKEQFWGPGWDQEPRLSREQDQRQKDRRQWLEDIVEMLKEQAKQERNRVREVQQQPSCPPLQPNLNIPPYRGQNTPPPQQNSVRAAVHPPVHSVSAHNSMDNGLSHMNRPMQRKSGAKIRQQVVPTRIMKEGRDVSPDMTISTTEPSSVGDVNSTESSKRTFTC